MLHDYQKLVLRILAVLGLLVFGYWLFVADSYTFTAYHVPECNKTLTVMVISSISQGERQVAFIPGEYYEHCLPKQDYLLAHLTSGLGGGLVCYVTCRGNQLVIHCDEGFIDTAHSALIASHSERGDDDLAAQALADIPKIVID